jgi:hypothetical protein
MEVFDQREQKVNNQTNIAGNQYNSGGHISHVKGEVVLGDKVAGNKNVIIVKELEALLRQVQEATQSGDLDAETAVDVEHSLKKAALEAGKEQPDKERLLEHVDNTKTLLEKVVSISKSVGTLSAAAAAAYAKIQGWW